MKSPHRFTEPLVILTLILLSRLIYSTGQPMEYDMIDLADPLQPVWDRLDALPKEIIEPLRTELQAGMIQVENNLERKMRSLISVITSRISSLASRVGGGRGGSGGGGGGGGGEGTNLIGSSLNQTLNSMLRGLYLSTIQVSRDEATLKIENHINDQINQLEERMKMHIDDKFSQGLAGIDVSTSTQGETSNTQTTNANPSLVLRLDTLVRSIQTNNATLHTINTHVSKINEKLDDGDTCGTLVDKVSELMDNEAPSGSASPSSSSSSSSCQSLDAQNMRELRSALERLRETPAFLPRDCSDHHWQNPEAPTGVFTTYPTMDPKFSYSVYCDMGPTTAKGTGGWTVILKRQNSTWDLNNFSRTWKAYRDGFGNPGEGEWWYGLSPLHALTYRQPYELKVFMHDIEKGHFYASYSTFRLEDEAQDFSLVVSGFSGNVSMDALAAKHHGSPFSTMDRDNDLWEEGNCAVSNGGGWWYNRCHYTTLTAFYPNSTDRDAKTIRWRDDDGWLVFDDVTLMIRPTGYSDRFDAITTN